MVGKCCLIFFLLDLGNSFYSAGLPKKSVRQLQLIKNSAARVLTKTKKVDDNSPPLRSLHWLPVHHRMYFKVLMLVYKALNGLGPKYFSDILTQYEPSRPLRSFGSVFFHQFPESEPDIPPWIRRCVSMLGI